MTYDGTGKASGTKVYMNGKVLDHNIEADGLSGTIHAAGSSTVFQISEADAEPRLTITTIGVPSRTSFSVAR